MRFPPIICCGNSMICREPEIQIQSRLGVLRESGIGAILVDVLAQDFGRKLARFQKRSCVLWCRVEFFRSFVLSRLHGILLVMHCRVEMGQPTRKMGLKSAKLLKS